MLQILQSIWGFIESLFNFIISFIENLFSIIGFVANSVPMVLNCVGYLPYYIGIAVSLAISIYLIRFLLMK